MAEVVRLAVGSIDSKADKATEYTSIYSLLSGIRLVCTPPVVIAAEQAARSTLYMHGMSDPPTPTEQPTDTNSVANALSTVCRREIDDLHARV